MPFVVPDVCRFTYVGHNEVRPWAVICDMQIDTTGTITDRNDAIVDQAGVLLKEWYDTIRPRISTTGVLDRVNWVDLDEADGSTGSITSAQGVNLPQAGTFTGEAAPANTSVLVRKQTVSRRGARQGRSYWSPLGEAGKNGSFLTSAELTAWQTAMNTWKGDVEQEGGALEFTSTLVVVHILTRDGDGNPATGDYTTVNTLAVDQKLATQRRRLRK